MAKKETSFKLQEIKAVKIEAINSVQLDSPDTPSTSWVTVVAHPVLLR